MILGLSAGAIIDWVTALEAELTCSQMTSDCTCAFEI